MYTDFQGLLNDDCILSDLGSHIHPCVISTPRRHPSSTISIMANLDIYTQPDKVKGNGSGAVHVALFPASWLHVRGKLAVYLGT